MSTETLERGRGPACDSGVAEEPRAELAPLEVLAEELLGNRIGSGVYRRWVNSLGLRGAEDVLEIGTGAGACARQLAAALPEGRLTCIDVDGRWLAIARRRLAKYGARVRLLERDASTFSLPDAFDVVIAHFVLHDLDPAARTMALGRIRDSLRAGGRLCLREPIEHGMTADELLGQIAKAGFEQVGPLGSGKVPLMGQVLSGTWSNR